MSRTNMVHTFSEVPEANIPRSKFKQVSTHKTTYDADYLIPMYVQDVLPGDTIKLRADIFARLATQFIRSWIIYTSIHSGSSFQTV